MTATYVLVVALMAVAFRGFGTDHTAGLFAFFALALVTGVAGPVYFTVWVEHRPLADLGLTVGDWPRVLGLAVLFGGTQFALTLWGYALPAARGLGAAAGDGAGGRRFRVDLLPRVPAKQAAAPVR